MSSLLERALGEDWSRLAPTLKAHYPSGPTHERGEMTVEFPPAMRAPWWCLSRWGALVDRRGEGIRAEVRRFPQAGRERWQRTLRYPDGAVRRFDSVWELTPRGHIVEFVNPYLGLELAPWLEGEGLRYRSVAYVLRLGRRQLALPRWLTPGQASIVERAVDAEHYAMDFRLVHPLFGQVFRYSGVFATGAAAYHGRLPDPDPCSRAPQASDP